jgi:hypothetical protein
VQPSSDIVSGGGDDRGVARWARRRRRWPTVVVVVALVVVVGGGWLDRVERQHEFAALLANAANGQATAVYAAAQTDSTRQYAMPLLVTSSSLTVRVGLEQLVDQSAAKGAADVRTTRHAVANLTVLPWHTSLRRARAANLAYLDTWTAYLDSVSHGGDLGALPTQRLATQLETVAAALRSAAPNETAALKADALVIPSTP